MNDARAAHGPSLGPSLGLGPRPIALEPSINTTRLAIRVWSSTRGAATWKSESTLVYMLADLVSASNGVATDDSGIGLVAQFDHPAEAFRAAKRIQWSVLEFSQQRPDQCVGAAIVVYHASDLPAANQEEASQGIISLLEQAKPAQIFIAANACRLLQGIPGLQLRQRPRPSLSAGALERGVQELIWTTPQTYRRVQEILKQASRKVSPKADPIMISEPTVDHLSAAGITPGMANASVSKTQTTLFRVDHPSAIDPEPVDSPAALENEDTESRSLRSGMLWWSVAAVGAMVVLAGIFFAVQPRKKTALSEVPPPVQQQPSSPDSAQKPIADPPPQATEQIVPSHPSRPADTDGAVAKPVAQERPSRPKLTTPKATTPKITKVSEYEGFTEKNIPTLIHMADGHAGSGNYADARAEYEIVLHLDPNNAAAKQGIRKLNLSEER